MTTKFPDNEEELNTSLILASQETEPLWTVQDVANYLRLKPETVRNMARRGELPSLKIGKRVWRFRIGEVKNWLFHNEEVHNK